MAKKAASKITPVSVTRVPGVPMHEIGRDVRAQLADALEAMMPCLDPKAGYTPGGRTRAYQGITTVCHIIEELRS